MKHYIKTTAFIAILFAGSANADVTVKQQILQQGLFRSGDCEITTEITPAECLCRADIRYPEIKGLGDVKAQSALNEKYKTFAEQNKCAGNVTNIDDKEGQYSARITHKVVFQSSKLIAIEINSSVYTGGAHGMDSSMEDIIDIKTGKTLSPNDIFTVQNIPAVNNAIYNALLEKQKKEEGILPDEVEGRKGKFITDNKCNDCTVKVDKDGVKVVFDNYAVSSFAAGPQSVTVPDDLIGNYDIISALAQKK